MENVMQPIAIYGDVLWLYRVNIDKF